MPIHKTNGKWQWGNHGAKYTSRAGAERQAAAAHANGYAGDKEATTQEVIRVLGQLITALKIKR